MPSLLVENFHALRKQAAAGVDGATWRDVTTRSHFGGERANCPEKCGLLDPGIRSFCDEIDHDWMLRILSHGDADRRMIRLVRKRLKAGTVEDGRRVASTRGTTLGACQYLPAQHIRFLGAATA